MRIGALDALAASTSLAVNLFALSCSLNGLGDETLFADF
jgi:hypothetical protein